MARGTKKKISTRSEEYIINKKHLGEEPTFTKPLTRIDYTNALNWYNYHSDVKDSKKYTIQYLKENKTKKETIEILEKAQEDLFCNLGFVCRIKMRGGPITETNQKWIDETIESIKRKVKPVVKEKTEETKTISIQDRIQEKSKEIIANELNATLKQTSGPILEKAGDLAALLTNLQAHDVLFIDEIHRLSPAIEEVLYPAMEDYQIDIIIGEGPAARSIKLDLPPFTLIGATTRAGLLPPPLRDRFGFTAHMDFYENDELAEIVNRSARLLKIEIDAKSILEIAGRSRGTPRIANRLLRRVRDFALVNKVSTIDLKTTQSALDMYEVDLLGLDRLDRAVLTALVERFNGGPVGLSTLAIAVGEEIETVEAVAEPFLVRTGLMARTARGRVATPQGFTHLGRKSPQGFTLFDSEFDANLESNFDTNEG